MSKRVSTTKLDHENWDKEDAPEEAGIFSSAPTEVLKKRVILKAQRRSKVTNSGEDKSEVPNIFRGIKLTGSVPSAPPSFSFLTNNASENAKTETLVSKSQTSFTFSNTVSTSEAPANTGEVKFSFPSAKTTPVSSSSSMTYTADSVSSSTNTTVTSTSSPSGPSTETVTTTQFTSSVFGSKMTFTSSSTFVSTPESKSAGPAPQMSFGNIFGNSVGKSSAAVPAREQVEKETDTGQFSFTSSDKNSDASGNHFKIVSRENAEKSPDSTISNSFIDKDKYYLMLHGLNKSVAMWIKDNVDKNPHCILTPIFSDYITHLNDIKTKYGKVKVSPGNEKKENVPSGISLLPNENDRKKVTQQSSSMVNGNIPDAEKKFLLPLPQASALQSKVPADKPQISAPFTLSAFATQKTFSKPEENFQPSSSKADKSVDLTSSGSKLEASSESKPDKSEENKDDDDDAEPSEPPPAPVVEDGAVYSKRCKVFIKKLGSYQDRGVGTAFIKPVVDNTKTQLIVRADNVLGNVLLNTLITSSIPIQRLGPNNVMVVCVPTPDEKPPPATVLLRVKTTADADELYEKLMGYKK